MKTPVSMQFGIKEGIIIIGEQKGGKFIPVTEELIKTGYQLSRQLLCPLTVILTQNNSACSLSADYPLLSFVDELIYIKDDLLTKYAIAMQESALVPCLKQKKPLIVFFGATSFGRILGACLAGTLRMELITDISAVRYMSSSDKIIITKSSPDGQNLAEYISAQTLTQNKRQGISIMVSARPGMLPSVSLPPADGLRLPAFLSIYPNWIHQEKMTVLCTEITEEKPSDISLNKAQIILSQGRGLPGADSVKLLQHLAEKMGASIGCSRPCVDAGWQKHARQIGQSGFSVKPKLYIAFGISGAVQHMAGVQADCIIAVNHNVRAPIFQYCDYGITADAGKIAEYLNEHW